MTTEENIENEEELFFPLRELGEEEGRTDDFSEENKYYYFREKLIDLKKKCRFDRKCNKIENLNHRKKFYHSCEFPYSCNKVNQFEHRQNFLHFCNFVKCSDYSLGHRDEFIHPGDPEYEIFLENKIPHNEREKKETVKYFKSDGITGKYYIAPDIYRYHIFPFLISTPREIFAYMFVSKLFFNYLMEDSIWKYLFRKNYGGFLTHPFFQEKISLALKSVNITENEGRSWKFLYRIFQCALKYDSKGVDLFDIHDAPKPVYYQELKKCCRTGMMYVDKAKDNRRFFFNVEKKFEDFKRNKKKVEVVKMNDENVVFNSFFQRVSEKELMKENEGEIVLLNIRNFEEGVKTDVFFLLKKEDVYELRKYDLETKKITVIQKIGDENTQEVKFHKVISKRYLSFEFENFTEQETPFPESGYFSMNDYAVKENEEDGFKGFMFYDCKKRKMIQIKNDDVHKTHDKLIMLDRIFLLKTDRIRVLDWDGREGKFVSESKSKFYHLSYIGNGKFFQTLNKGVIGIVYSDESVNGGYFVDIIDVLEGKFLVEHFKLDFDFDFWEKGIISIRKNEVIFITFDGRYNADVPHFNIFNFIKKKMRTKKIRLSSVSLMFGGHSVGGIRKIRRFFNDPHKMIVRFVEIELGEYSFFHLINTKAGSSFNLFKNQRTIADFEILGNGVIVVATTGDRKVLQLQSFDWYLDEEVIKKIL